MLKVIVIHQKVSYLILILLLSISSACASTTLLTQVKYTGIYGDGSIYIAVNGVIDESGCSGERFDVPYGHPHLKQILAFAMTAIATGKNVRIRTNGCDSGRPTLTQDKNSYFYITNDTQ